MSLKSPASAMLSGKLDPYLSRPPQKLLDALRDFFGKTLPHAKVCSAWQAAKAKATETGHHDENLIIQDSVNYLLDNVSWPTPSPPTTPADPDSDVVIVTPLGNLPLVGNHLGSSAFTEKTPLSDGVLDRKGKKRVKSIDWTQQHPSLATQSHSGASKRHRASHKPTNGPLASSSAAPALEPQLQLTGSEIAVRIHEIIPDVAEDFAIGLYHRQPNTLTCAQERIQQVINCIMEEPNYPKRLVKPLGRLASGSDSVEELEDKTVYERGLARWTSTNRPDPDPGMLPVAVAILARSFPRVGIPYLRHALIQKRHLAPAWIFIEEQLERPGGGRPVPLNKTTRPPRDPPREVCAELRDELEWLRVRQVTLAGIRAEEEQEKKLAALEALEGSLLECQCCFDTFRLVKMIQCPEGHLFCGDCVKRNADVQLGLNKAEIRCMDSSDCPFTFPKAELSKALNGQVMARLEQIALEESLEQANIEGLEKCPFCVWAVIIENEGERVLRCGNQKCLKESCRKCKKISHIPKTCQESLEEELKSNSMHIVAEAMTEALVRKCPKCRKAFVKESGCNKIRCAHCGTLSCYVCQNIVPGYEHFSNAGTNLKGQKPDPKAKCPLWDDTDSRHAQEVETALKEANQKLEQSGSTTEGNARLTAKDIESLKADPLSRQARAGPSLHPQRINNYRLNPQRAYKQNHGVAPRRDAMGELQAEQVAFQRLREQHAQRRAMRMAALHDAAQAAAALGGARGLGTGRVDEIAEVRRTQAGAAKMLPGPQRRR